MLDGAIRLLDYVIQMLSSLAFSLKHRITPASFSRSPQFLTFFNVSLMILRLVKKAIAVEQMKFFAHFQHFDRTPSRQAFSKAREKIRYTAIQDFFEHACEIAREAKDARLFRGYRLFAVDGTSFFVGDMNKPDFKDFFGDSTTMEGKAMCRISAVVDVLNDVMVHAKVAGFCMGERALAMLQLSELACVKNALFLFDRGYWSPELVRLIHDNGQKFLMRVARNHFHAVAKDHDGTTIPLRRHHTRPNG